MSDSECSLLNQTCRHLQIVIFFIFLKDLENALNCLQREDPSLKVRVDPDSGQVIAFVDYLGLLIRDQLLQ